MRDSEQSESREAVRAAMPILGGRVVYFGRCWPLLFRECRGGMGDGLVFARFQWQVRQGRSAEGRA